jgi:hypothetical protein
LSDQYCGSKEPFFSFISTLGPITANCDVKCTRILHMAVLPDSCARPPRSGAASDQICTAIWIVLDKNEKTNDVTYRCETDLWKMIHEEKVE